MAISDVTIINGALSKIGVSRILARGENNKQSKVADDTYDHLLDTVLTDAAWDFATFREELSASATAPVFEHDRIFPFPTTKHCLRILEVINLSEALWRVEGRTIVTSLTAPLQVRFIGRVTDEAQYSPLFVEAFQARLAMEWAETLIKQTTVQQTMAALYDSKISTARAIEAGGTGRHEDFTEGSWVGSRFSGGSRL